VEDIRQLVRASGSVAANWIEADEALSRKDFLMRIKICRKEAKESRLFLRLVDTGLMGATVSGRDKPRGRGARTDAHFFFDNLEGRIVRFFGFANLRFPWELGIGIWSLRLDK
jgi:hypothetical protein